MENDVLKVEQRSLLGTNGVKNSEMNTIFLAYSMAIILTM